MRPISITSKAEYYAAFDEFDALIATDYDSQPATLAYVQKLAQAISDFEDASPEMSMPIPIPPKPETLPAMIELKRQQKRLKQKDLATLLEIPAGRLSQILSGKRRVSLDLAKKLHERLNISPAFILRTA